MLSGALFLYLAFCKTDLSKTVELIREAALLPIFMSFVLRGFGLWIRAIRWQIMLKPIKDTSSLNLFQVLCVAEMGNYLLPSKLSEIIRIVMVAKRDTISRASALASVFIDRLFDLLALLVMFTSLSFLFEFPPFIRECGLFAAIFLGLITIAGTLLLRFRQVAERLIEAGFQKYPICWRN